MSEKTGVPALSPPVKLARSAVEHHLLYGTDSLPLPEELPEWLLGASKGVFVCLKREGELRGCIGTIEPVFLRLADEIISNAVAAATRDPRFPPVRAEEIPFLTYGVDILEEPEAVLDIEELDPSIFGVIVTSGSRRGLLLPDLEGIDSGRSQVEIACSKAGIDPSEEIQLQRFRVSRYR